MHVITRRRLKEFWAVYPDAETPLEIWYRAMKKERFTDFAHLKQTFGSADYVSDLVVFNIGGNKYRLIAAIHYNTGEVYIRHVLTHAEYDRDNWKKRT
jgi:mRNA interferase HigB